MKIKIDENILLSQVKLSDAADIFYIIDTQREYLGKWLLFVEHTKTVKDTEAFLKSVIEVPEDSAELVFVIRWMGTLIGLIGFRNTDKANRRTEVGYWLSEDFQKRGIITKSLKCLVEIAFEERNINRIALRCAVRNDASKNVALRAGFRFEGTERKGELLSEGKFRDLEVYSRLSSD
ncbi:MAG TPA: N-acetyltransferase [Spirochaeta sp.]|nr:N-acetyltransferase [Spirochaeta sp.]